jgi:hypothetical protein
MEVITILIGGVYPQRLILRTKKVSFLPPLIDSNSKTISPKIIFRIRGKMYASKIKLNTKILILQ